ncbi:MAG TPA: methylmalonyl Co-A mutase-associated GTPase MeaB [Candidatus Kapabacteria bacterium]|nr:methylmalonyl Co-A mutase-associated GTPase MeaB [Candidatus Kapabacteria bacterium]
MSATSLDPFIEKLLRGEKRAISRAITEVENETPQAEIVLRKIFHNTGRAFRIGITGPPGAGKSTLTNELAKYYRKQNLTIGILAVDPTSPFTGGALLGDRIRMQTVALDEGVFIRSMATRGSLGGLSKKAKDAADVLDAAGKDVIIFETVGVGQSELDVAQAADTTVVVLVPESGDSVQAMKAGLMEIADVFVMNKSDREGANQAVTALKAILQFRVTHEGNEWIPPVVKTIGSEGKGIDEMVEEIANHRKYESSSGVLRTARTRQLRERIHELVNERMNIDFWTPERESLMEKSMVKVVERTLSPYDVAEKLLETYGASSRKKKGIKE